MPEWLPLVATISVIAGIVCAVIVSFDVWSHPQRMWIMNAVWPLTALYSGPIGLVAYLRVGRPTSRDAVERTGRTHDRRPTAVAAALGATHCGAGCTLGDIVAEWFVFFVPLRLFGSALAATWVLDFALAFLFGIAFQYFTIAPMRGLNVRDGIVAALKADTASLTAWQFGMYGWMAIAIFAIFGHELDKTEPVFWFMMQIAMIVGFVVSWPVNALLIKNGWKERM
ncbi:MAG TPA: DUF4396 domain-containing protein [Casimicrobiaceae bacterium]|jgi:hypothetical protein